MAVGRPRDSSFGLHLGQPDGKTIVAGKHAVGVLPKHAECHQPSLAARCTVGLRPDQSPGRKVTVVLAIKAQATALAWGAIASMGVLDGASPTGSCRST